MAPPLFATSSGRTSCGRAHKKTAPEGAVLVTAGEEAYASPPSLHNRYLTATADRPVIRKLVLLKNRCLTAAADRPVFRKHPSRSAKKKHPKVPFLGLQREKLTPRRRRCTTGI